MLNKALVCGIVLLAACEQKSGFVIGNAEQAKDCDLTYDGLGGTEWVILQINPDKTETPNHTARLKFESPTKIKYNAGSISNMYDFECTMNDSTKELECLEHPARIQDWCQAFLAADKECTPEQMKKIDPNVSDEEIAEGIKKAQEFAEPYKKKGGEDWKKYVFSNNNLGNKLQGRVYVKIDEKKCRLRITDNYITIHDGKVIEDSNPVGTNAFVKNELGDLLWENCTATEDLVTRAEADFPKDPAGASRKANWAIGEDVNLWYLGDNGLKAQEGCTYSYDVWLNGKPVEKDLTPEVADGHVHWHATFKAEEPAPQHAVFMHRRWKCGEEEQQEEVSCAAFSVK